MILCWGWPIAEVIHFFGLCLLFATVGMFDLRMMGLARGVSMKELHRLVPVGVAGYLLCAATGFCFIVSAPGQYTGVTGPIVKRGRTRYKVRIAGGVLSVPFAHVEAAG